MWSALSKLAQVIISIFHLTPSLCPSYQCVVTQCSLAWRDHWPGNVLTLHLEHNFVSLFYPATSTHIPAQYRLTCENRVIISTKILKLWKTEQPLREVRGQVENFELSHDNILIQSGLLITPYIPTKILFPLKISISRLETEFNKVLTDFWIECYLLIELHSQLNVWQIFVLSVSVINRSDGVKIGNNKN